MSKKEIKITNWQVPRAPEAQKYDDMKRAPAFNPDNHKDLGKIHHTDSVEAVVERTVAKQEAARGQAIDQAAPKQTVNLNGINDERQDREFWVPPRIGKR